ncbi:carbonate dehydratase [Pyruvatibacter sp.]|uniref:carbonate dehydratase n=1 Tax=Pyruvatibacter sp. TaxID=1981328 RepID=UPI0032EAF87A
MTKITDLFVRNRLWAERMKSINPAFFSSLADQQNPEFLWIGCADSRVPANEIIDLRPGGVFVHRNIANVVVPSDLNCLSVIQYAVEVLGVKHIIVCGHYGCGGVRASIDEADHGLIDNWLHHIRDVHRLYASDFTPDMSEEQKVDRLCELNVIEQVRNVANTTILRHAWERDNPIEVHGWVYSIKDGIIHDLCTHTADGLKAR